LNEIADTNDPDSIHDHLNTLLLALRDRFLDSNSPETLIYYRSLASILSKMVSVINVTFENPFLSLSASRPEVISEIQAVPKSKKSLVTNANNVVVNYYFNDNAEGILEANNIKATISRKINSGRNRVAHFTVGTMGASMKD
jgi:hypothetical protein